MTAIQQDKTAHGPRKSRKRNAGYTVMEMIVYVAVLAIAINLCGKLFLSGSRLSALNTQALDRLLAVSEIEKEFGRAARESVALVPEAGKYRSGEHVVVFRAEPEAGAPCYVVFGAVRDAEHVSRMDLVQRNGTLACVRFETFRQPLSSIVFDASRAPLMNLAVVIKKDPGERNNLKIVHQFAAALRGIGEFP